MQTLGQLFEPLYILRHVGKDGRDGTKGTCVCVCMLVCQWGGKIGKGGWDGAHCQVSEKVWTAWMYDSGVAKGGEMVWEDSDERACVHARVPVGWRGQQGCMLVCQLGGGVSKGARPRPCQSEREGVSGTDMRQRGWRGKTVWRVCSSCGMWTWRNFVIQTCHVIMVGGVRRSYHIPRAYNLCLLYVSCCTYIVYPDTCASYWPQSRIVSMPTLYSFSVDGVFPESPHLMTYSTVKPTALNHTRLVCTPSPPCADGCACQVPWYIRARGSVLGLRPKGGCKVLWKYSICTFICRN